MKKLTFENYSELNQLSKLANYEEYNSNIVTMLMWNHYYEISYELFDHYAVILVKYPNKCAINYKKKIIIILCINTYI